jgi:hypothetical protein
MTIYIIFIVSGKERELQSTRIAALFLLTS